MKSIQLGVCLLSLATAVQAGVLLNENFSYPDGSLTDVSAGRWVTHSGTAGQVTVASGAITLTQSQSEDLNATLGGGPYAKDSAVVLYAAFKATFTALPSATGTYFAHFKNASSGFNAKLFATTAGAEIDKFRLGISRGANTATPLETDLTLGTTYTVVVRYEIDTQAATLWVDPTSEADPGVNATDTATANDVVAFAFREASGMGTLVVDDLRVATSFEELFGAIDSQPAITGQPQSLTVAAGAKATFIVVATGAEPLGYQWQHSLTNLPDATGATLTLNSVTDADAGPYRVVVTNSFGSAASDEAILTVTNAPPAGVVTNIAYLHTLQDPVNFALTDTNTLFTVEGIVTTWTNLTSTSGGLFYLQDDTGGIAVFHNHVAGVVPPAGARVRVTGPLSQYNGLLELYPDADQAQHEVITLSTGNALPAPRVTSPTELTALIAADLEANWEGRLVTFTNLTLPPDVTTFPANKTVTVTDEGGFPYALFVNRYTDIGGQTVPTGSFAVVGVLSQFDSSDPRDSGYQILPSRFADIITASKAPTVRFTNVVENLVRPGDLPTNAFTEMGLRPGEKLTIQIAVTDPLGGTVTVQPGQAGLPASAQWSFATTSGASVEGTFRFNPTAAEAGQLYAVTLLAWNAGATNTTTWQIYVPTAAEQQVAITEYLANPSTDAAAPQFNPLRRDPPSDNPSQHDEYLELANLSGTDLDLAGWTIADAVQVRHKFYDSFALGSKNAIIVYGGPLNGMLPNLDVLSIPASESSAGLALNNTGDTVIVRNATGGIVERVVYSSAMVSSSGSMTRYPTIDSGFVAQTSVGTAPVTPGRQYDGKLWSEPPTIPATDIGPVSITLDANSSVTLSWQAETGRTYSVVAAPSLSGPWTPAATGLTAGSFNESVTAGTAARFYRVSSP